MKLSSIALVAGFCLVVGLPMAATAGPSSSADGADADGIGQAFDNCTNSSNAGQVDSDHDGCGDFCDFDWNNDGIVKAGEVAKASNQAGSAACGSPSCPGPPFFCCVCDFNHDGICKAGEVAKIATQAGLQPGPSGLAASMCKSPQCNCINAP